MTQTIPIDVVIPRIVARRRGAGSLAAAGLVLLALIGSSCAPSERPDDGLTEEDRARRILAGARRALGPEADLRAVTTLRARATVAGPGGEFETLVHSAIDGRGRMEQTGGFVAVTDGTTGSYTERAGGEVAVLGDTLLALLRGHELHALVLAPEARLRAPRARPDTVFGRDSALVVSFDNVIGARVDLYFATSDTLPLGMRETWPDPDVEVVFDAWRTVNGVRLFTKAEFRQGEELYRYDYVEIGVNDFSERLFESVDGVSR